MKKTRADDAIARGAPVSLTVDGEPLRAYRGQTVAAALQVHGTRILRRTRFKGQARGYFCGMGICYDCLVEVDGRTERACVTKVEEGMRVSLTGRSGAAAESA